MKVCPRCDKHSKILGYVRLDKVMPRSSLTEEEKAIVEDLRLSTAWVRWCSRCMIAFTQLTEYEIRR